MQFIRHLEPFQNVSATGRAVLSSKLVLGNVIERIYLLLGGGAFTKAMISAIRIRLNGKVIFGDIPGTDLNTINSYILLNGANANFLTIDFTEPGARSIQGQLMGAINTNAAGVTDFAVEVDIAGATTPTLDAYVQLRSPASMGPGNGFDPNLSPVIRALIPTTIPITAAGELQADVNYGSGGTSLLKRLFVFPTTVVMASLRIKRDALDVFEGVSSALDTFAALDYGRVAQASMYVWDPLWDGNQSDAYPTRRPDNTPSNYQFLFTTTGGAGSVKVYADAYSTLGAL